MTTVLDGEVKPGRGTYSEIERECGCRGVPEGQHLPGCGSYDLRRVTLQLRCAGCGYASAREHGRCSFCGAG